MAKNEPIEVEINGRTRVLSFKEAQRLLRSLVNKARELLATNDIQAAKLECALALKIDDKDIEALEVFGDIAKTEGNLKISRGMYQAAYEAGGRSPTLIMALLAEYLRLGDFVKGKEYAIELTKNAPKIKTGWKNLTEINILNGDLDKASATLELWATHLGKSDEIEYYESVIAWKKGDKQTAYKKFRNLAERGTSLGQVYHYLSVHHFDKEEYQETIPYLKKYLELEGPDKEAEAILQECYREVFN